MANRVTCEKCGVLFPYAENNEGTTPTRCLSCDPDNEHAVRYVRGQRVEASRNTASNFPSAPIPKSVKPDPVFVPALLK